MNDTYNTITEGMLLNGRYKLIRPLSSDGGTADVWLALDTLTIDTISDDFYDLGSKEETGIKVAIKIYRPKNALDMGDQLFRDEFKIVHNCHHTNLIQPINFDFHEDIPYLVLPYCQNGSSERLQGKITDNDELWKYIAHVSAGLAYLHMFNPTIVHHDIKPANILIDDSKNYAITDFGISSHTGYNRDGYEDNQSGTMAYMAPERFKDVYDSIPESDIWSFGATLYELITGTVPFGESGGQEQLEHNPILEPIKQDIPKDMKRLIYDCLSLDPSKRPTAQAIHEAAVRQNYKRSRINAIAIAAVIIVCLGVLIAGLIYFFDKSDPPTEVSEPVIVSDEIIYDQAMSKMASDDQETMSAAILTLDSLSNRGYVPAMYELARTYGWYSDSASIYRKQTLGIDMYPEGSNNAYLPTDNKYNNKAVKHLNQIKEASNPEYPKYNADALYRLSSYYISTDKVYKYDPDYNPKYALELLNEAMEWAEKCNDDTTIYRINKILPILKSRIKK